LGELENDLGELEHFLRSFFFSNTLEIVSLKQNFMEAQLEKEMNLS